MKTIPDQGNSSPSYILHEKLFEYIQVVETTGGKTPPNAARAYFLFGSLLWNALAVLDRSIPFIDGFKGPRVDFLKGSTGKQKWGVYYTLVWVLWNELRASLYTNMTPMTNPTPLSSFAIVPQFRKAVRLYLKNRKTDGYDNKNPLNYANQGIWIDANSGALQDLSAVLTDVNAWAPIETTVSGGVKKKQSPLHPFYGDVRNWFSSSDWVDILFIADQFYPSNTTLQEQVEQLKEVNSNLSPLEKMKAEVWAGFEPQRATPPGKSMILLALVLAAKNYSYREAAALICGAGACLFHAAISAWKIKYIYMQPRPIQLIRINYFNQNIVSAQDGVTKNGGLWLPYQPNSLLTPPFPDYISGHSTFTMAFSTFMNLALGTDEIPLAGCVVSPEYFQMFSQVFDDMMEPTLFSNLSLKPDCSLIVSGTPNIPIELNWKTWSDIAREAGMSRIYGGIHWENSNAGGLAVGQWIASSIMNKLQWNKLKFSF